MNERWEQVKDIFQATLERPSAERERFLSGACGADSALYNEIRQLLWSFESAGGFMQKGAIGEVAQTIVGQSENIEIGQQLGRYAIAEKLGAGGMGEVFLAQDAELERFVALKLISAEDASDNERIRRFFREARAISALNHPNILTIHEIGQSGGWHFIATEFIHGETLRAKIERGSVKLAQALEIAAQIAAALGAAHAANIVHRDIKPENVMLRDDGIVKVLDFGLAKLTENKSAIRARQSAIETMPGAVMGTAAYMSPEQARGLSVDAQTDIWSLGVVLYEMLAGKLPFAGETKSDTIALILTAEPAPLTGNAPAELNRIIGKSLQKKADERYQSINDFLLDLKILKKRIEFEPEESSFKLRTTSANSDSNQANIAENSVTDKTELPPNNLTKNPPPLVGREKEIAEIADLIGQSNVRLVTLTGVGGTGKTRLAQAVARAVLPEFSDGVFFIELAAVANPELVAATVAAPLGVKEAGGKPILDRLKDRLREREMLIVIDNFEQVVDAAPQIAEMLRAAGQLKIVITSRVVLHLSAEHEFVVPPLAVPSPTALDSLDELSKYEAIKLFVARAQAVKSNFALTKENAPSVGEICARLDGLPLAIELAAARSKILSPPMILGKLENRLKLLTGGARDLPARQQTMRDTIAWSYDLLAADEKRLFRRLAIFAGGFTFEAAENVAGDESVEKNANNEFGEQSFAVLDGIASLVDKSLLISKEQTDGGVRLRMLETVREYALEALTASGEEETLRRSHANYFLRFGEEAEPHLQAAQSAEWVNRVEDESDNLRAALRWSLEHDAETAGRLAGAIRNFWVLHSHLTEGSEWLKAAAERNGDAPAAVRFKLLHGCGVLTRLRGEYETARKVHAEALEIGRAASDLNQIVLSGKGLGLVEFQTGNYAAARKYYQENLMLYTELKDKFGVAVTLNSLGDLVRAEGDYMAARPLYQEALRVGRELGNKQFVSANLINMGAVAFYDGDYKAAQSYFTEALTMARELGSKINISYSLDGFAALAVKRGDVKRAARLAAAAENLRESAGCKIEPAERRFREAYLAELRAALPENDFAAAYEQGSKLKLDEAVALVESEPTSTQ